ncbi:hypothetical protein ASPZODRAFT_155310 [Penicilliopsis zonata CBS 506.65]|uniref:Zn(2)-C6 fungal-type domain-containing protein n=1 Tax=Penicilliopsis zonata CBS 506.65 TaxID=1073090 RepID=A0A1L9S5F9_9EURO|nr:hypothetical protein ASPZODRAFT_155310 [Penicilliopsis zonata CBS 506.65]OJJ42391.1 hypothetical protein ASPZODRAFT_155310 [Penicilliopsis zonata CBS 506.65]
MVHMVQYFWPASSLGPAIATIATRQDEPPTPTRELRKSRFGCKNCKRRRVKCDETFPVCLRCQKRGAVCEAVPQLRQWQVEVPSLALPASVYPASPRHRRLVRYWCERASQIMVLDPDLNPFSFPIVAYLEQSPALLHTITSIGAAHEQFFHKDRLETCLEERSVALGLLRAEVGLTPRPLPTTFLSVFMLGLSSSWIQDEPAEFGYEHLSAARALIDLIIASPDLYNTPFATLALGSYLYWDMACSFLVDPRLHTELNVPSMYSAVQSTLGVFHPITGYFVEIMYLLGNLGRYCRCVVESGVRNPLLEHALEEQLLAWEPSRTDQQLGLLGDAFKNHGLINLYRICGRPGDDQDEPNQDTDHDDFTDQLIRQYAVQTVRDLILIPTTNWYTNMQAICLLTAGSELTAADDTERMLVVERFNALYSINRLPANLKALEILDDTWQARDRGDTRSWLHFMLHRGLRLMLG